MRGRIAQQRIVRCESQELRDLDLSHSFYGETSLGQAEQVPSPSCLGHGSGAAGPPLALFQDPVVLRDTFLRLVDEAYRDGGCCRG